MKMIAKLMGLWLNLLALVAPRTAGRKGFWLACTPIAPPVKPHHRQFLDTAFQEKIEYNGTYIQSYRWGTGPKRILFLHGWQSHSFRWKNYIDAFPKDEYTVYAIDAPAHGLSGGKYINLPIYSDAIEAFLKKVQPIDTVVSHSFGSFASLHSLHRNPGLPIQSLIVTGCPGEATDFISYYRGVLGLNDRTMRVMRGQFLISVGHYPEYFSAVQFAKDAKVPGLIIHDEGDDEAPVKYARAIHSNWPNSKLIVTQGLGHNLKSAEVVKMVVKFAGEEVEVEEKVDQSESRKFAEK